MPGKTIDSFSNLKDVNLDAIYCIDIDNNSITPFWETHFPYECQISPDGKSLAVLSSEPDNKGVAKGNLHIITLSNKEVIHIKRIETCSWSPTLSTTLCVSGYNPITATDETGVYIYDYAKNECKRIADFVINKYYTIQKTVYWAPFDNMIYIVHEENIDQNETIWQYNTADSSYKKTEYELLKFSANGQYNYFDDSEATLELYNLQTKEDIADGYDLYYAWGWLSPSVLSGYVGKPNEYFLLDCKTQKAYLTPDVPIYLDETNKQFVSLGDDWKLTRTAIADLIPIIRYRERDITRIFDQLREKTYFIYENKTQHETTKTTGNPNDWHSRIRTYTLTAEDQKKTTFNILKYGIECIAYWIVNACMEVKGSSESKYTDQFVAQMDKCTDYFLPLSGIILLDHDYNGISEKYCYRNMVEIGIHGIVNGSENAPTKEDAALAQNSNAITYISNAEALIGVTVDEYRKYGPHLDVNIGTNEAPTIEWTNVVLKAYLKAINERRNELFVIWAKANLK